MNVCILRSVKMSSIKTAMDSYGMVNGFYIKKGGDVLFFRCG